MLTKVQKWGNSLAIRIPHGFAEQLEMKHDSLVDLSLDQDRLIIRPSRKSLSIGFVGASDRREHTWRSGYR